MNWDEDENEATHIFGGNDPQLDGSWQVNVTETDTRTMTAVEIGVEFGRGNLDANDTFVWREGMRDWVALGKCPELFGIIAQYGGQRSQSAAPPPPPRASIAPTAPMPITSFAVPTMPPPAMPSAPAPRPMQPSVPFATPPALSAGQSPLRGPIASSPPYGPGATVVPTEFGRPAPIQTFTAAQVPPPRGNGLILGGVIAVLIIALGLVLAAYLLFWRVDPSKSAVTETRPSNSSKSDSANEAPPTESETASTASASAAMASALDQPVAEGAASSSAASAADAAASAEAGADSGSDTRADVAAKGGSPTTQVAKTAPTGYSNGSPSNGSSSNKSPSFTTKPEGAKSAAKPAGEFDVNAARSALTASAGAASGCGKPGGPKGRGRATVMFSPSGSVSSALVDGPFTGTPVGSCVAAAFRAARVPPFSGGSQSVTKSFTVR